MELRLKILANGCFFVLGCRNVECLHHDAGSTIALVGVQHLLPNCSILVIGQDLLLPGAVEQSSWFFPQSFDEVTIVDGSHSASCASPGRGQARLFDNRLLPQIAHPTVVVKMYRQLSPD